jgi:hypothetical protein
MIMTLLRMLFRMVLCCILLFWGITDLGAIELVKERVPVATIVTSDQPHVYVSDAVNLLNKYVQLISTSTLPVLTESEITPDTKGPFVYVGATQAARKAGLSIEQLKLDDFYCKVVGGDLYLLGRDEFFNAPGQSASHYGCRGTLNSVYRLLYDHCSVKWLMPIPGGTQYSKSGDIRVPDSLNLTVSYPFGYTAGRFAGYGEWSQAHGFRRAAKAVLFGGHSWGGAILHKGKPDELLKKDPTMFALQVYKDGSKHRVMNWRPNYDKKTERWRGPNRIMLCTTHPDYVDMNVRFYDKIFGQGYDWAEFNISDGYRRCECEKCESMDDIGKTKEKNFYYASDWDRHVYEEGLPSPERIWIPLHAIATKLYKKYPNKKIIALMYSPTSIPSRKIKEWPPNVIMSMARQHQTHFDQFASFKEKAAYVYWWGSYCSEYISPKETPREIHAELAKFSKNNVKGIYFGGGQEMWAWEGRAYYTTGVLMTHPDKPLREIVDEYDHGVYGKAAPVMRKLFDIVEERRQLGWQGRRISSPSNRNYSVMPPSSYLMSAYPPEVILRMEALMTEALKLAETEVEFSKKQVQTAAVQMQVFLATANGFNAYEQYARLRTPEAKEGVDSVLKQREKAIAALSAFKNDPTLKEWFPGYGAYHEYTITGGRLSSDISRFHPYKKGAKGKVVDWDLE